MSEPDTVHKILLVGLDQAGKTSILNVLNEKYNLMDNIKPTVGIERDEIKILGIPIRTWDLGGQEKFRKDYLKLKNVRIFDQADSIFFVIDVWNATRFEEALNYYSQILEIYEKLGQRPKIEILLHKVDPNLRHDPKTDEILKNLKNLFQEESIAYRISLYATSIFDRKSIIEAFSKNLQELIVELKPFKKLLESIAILLKLDAAIILDESLMILGEHYKNKATEEICLNTVYNSVYYITNTRPELADEFTQNFELVLNVKGGLKRFTFMEVKFRGWNLFLLTMSKNVLDTDAVLSKFKTMAHIFERKEKAQ